MTDHLTWDTLNTLGDGLLPEPERTRTSTHLRACAECADALETLQATVAATASLPRDIAPPAELWTEVRATIDARKRARLGTHGEGYTPRWFVSPRRLVAAAIVLIAVSSAATVALMRGRMSDAPSDAVSIVVSASWQNAERGYLASVEELRGHLDSQRARLTPATIAAVEASLGTIDSAIAEARAALLRDPSNAALPELLASNYRQKVELLRRATQLAPS